MGGLGVRFRGALRMPYALEVADVSLQASWIGAGALLAGAAQGRTPTGVILQKPMPPD